MLCDDAKHMHFLVQVMKKKDDMQVLIINTLNKISTVILCGSLKGKTQIANEREQLKTENRLYHEDTNGFYF